MYTEEGIFSTVSSFVEEWMDKNSSCAITLDSRFAEDLGINSLDIMTVVVNSENEFDIEIADEKVKDFKTVGDIVSCIWEKVKPLA